MITVEEKEDGTQVWAHPLEGDYTFIQLSELHPGDRLEADHRRLRAHVITPADLQDFATAGPDPSAILVRARSATPADRAKPPRRGQGPGNNRGNDR
jgi:hypothetical protein